MAFSIGGFSNNAIPAGQSSYGNMQKLNEIAQQAQARAALANILKQYGSAVPGAQPQMASNQNAVQPLPGAAPTNPGMPSPPGGVSPSGGTMSPTGGAPGGAPTPMPGGTPMPQPQGGQMQMPQGGFDMQRLVQAVQGQQGLSSGAQGFALQNASSLLLPQERLQDALYRTMYQQQGQNARTGANIDSREKIAGENIGSREGIAKLSWAEREKLQNQTLAYRKTVAQAGPKLKDDMQFRTLEDAVKAAQAAYSADSSPDNLQVLHDATKAQAEYAKKAATTPAPAAKETIAPAPAAEERVSVIKGGQTFNIPKSQLQDALSQGYTQ